MLFGDYGTGDALYNLTINQAAPGKVWFEYAKSTGSYLRISSTLSASQWYKVDAVRYVDNTVDLYINGVLDNASASGTVGAVNPTALSKVTLGRAGNYNGQYFGGKLALPRVCNRALSALEVRTQFDREKHLFGVW